MGQLSSLKLTFIIVLNNCAAYISSSLNGISLVYIPVCNIVSKKHKVFNSIIVSYMVDMMNNFFRSKKSTNMFFHNKSVLRNIHLIMMRVVGCVFMNISMSLSKEYDLCNITTRLRTILSSIGDKPMWLNWKRLSTMKTRFINSCRVCFPHASPRASLLILLTASKFLITNFAGGEAAPSLYGRTDTVPYFACAKTLENVLVTHYGSAFKTPGTHYVSRTKASAAVKLIPFIFSTGDSYMLEFGNLYMRVFRQGGSVVETATNISGITKADPAVVTVSGTAPANGSTIDIESVGGMVEVNNRRFKVANRTSTTFELTDEDGNNIDSSGYTTYTTGGTIEKVYELVTPYATADLSKLRFTQQADIMYIDCAGYAPRKLSRFGHTNWTIAEYVYDQYTWPAFLDLNTTATTITPSATTGSITLTASASLFVAGHVDTYMRIVHSTTQGYVKITAYTDATHVTASVIATLGGTGATDDWAECAWSGLKGYPEDCKFYENRLYHIATTTNPLAVWGSVIDEYENYQRETGTDLTNTDEDSVFFVANAAQVDKLLWIYPTATLNLGSAGGPFTMSNSSATEVISATNPPTTKQQNENGSANIVPVRIGSYVYYVERSGKVLGQFAYSLDQDAYITDNVTYLSDHILDGGVKEMALMRYPYNILWAVLNDGTIATLTREQKNEVKGWTRQSWVGDVENVAVIPNGEEDQVWFVINRTIDGVARRYVEYLSAIGFDDVEDAFFVQSGLTYDGVATTTISGLDHLEGETVQVLVDGATHPDRVVTDGAITLVSEAQKVHAGLGYDATIETLDIEAGAAMGTAQARPKLLGRCSVRLKDSVGCLVGTVDKQDVIPFRSSDDNMDEALPMFSGDREVVFPQGWTKEKCIVIKQSLPLPMHCLAIYPKITVSD